MMLQKFFIYSSKPKNQSLLAHFPILQAHLLFRVIRRVMQTICFDFTKTHDFLQNHMVDSDAIYGYNTGRALQS